MTTRRTYQVLFDSPEDIYERVLRTAALFSQRCGVIVRSELVRLTEAATDLLVLLEPKLVRQELVARWPGTELTRNRMSRRYIYDLDDELLGWLVQSATSPFQWVNPDLPEDLHFMRQDGSTVLGTTAQEDDLWLELDNEECDRWRDAKDAPIIQVAT